MDMRDPFIAATKASVEDYIRKTVFDKFHITKHMNMALDDVRRKESRDADAKELLKKTGYLRLYSPGKLPGKYRGRYEALQGPMP